MKMAAYLDEEGEISPLSESSKEQPWSLGCNDSPSLADYRVGKRPLINNVGSQRLGPPRARWKHPEWEPNAGERTPDGRRRWSRRDGEDRKRSADRIQQSGQSRDQRNERMEAPKENRTNSSNSRNSYGDRGRGEPFRMEPGIRQREGECDRYSPANRSRQYGYRDGSQDRRGRWSRSSSRSATNQSRSVSRPSASFGRDEEREAWSVSRRARFTPAATQNQSNKRRREQSGVGRVNEPLRSSPPLKKRWVPPGSLQTKTNGVGNANWEQPPTHVLSNRKDSNEIGENSPPFGDGVNQKYSPSGERQHQVSGKSTGESDNGNDIAKGKLVEEKWRVSETRTTPSIAEKKGPEVVTVCSVADKSSSLTSDTSLGEGEKPRGEKKEEGCTSPKGNNTCKLADGDGDANRNSMKVSHSLSDAKCIPLASTKKLDVEATPDLTEASFVEECHAKTCSILFPETSDVDPAMVIVSESPHSLNPVAEVLPIEVCERRNEPSQRDNQNVSSTRETVPSAATEKATETVNAAQLEKSGSADQQDSVSELNNDTDSSDDDTSSSEDEEEIMRWAQKMFGIALPGLPANGLTKNDVSSSSDTTTDSSSEDESASSSSSALGSSIWSDSELSSLSDHGSAEKRVPPRFQKKKKATGRPSKRSMSKGSKEASTKRTKAAGKKKKAKPTARNKTASRKKLSTKKTNAEREQKLESERLAAEEAKRVKELAKPPTASELKAILADENAVTPSNHWVRRSVRQPSKSVLNAPKTRSLLEKLSVNDGDMVVLKMKKYLSDPDTPSAVIDVVLDALEENTNCQALYIQVCVLWCFLASDD